MSTTYLLRKTTGDFVTVGELDPNIVPQVASEVFTTGTFEHALRMVREHPELGSVTFPRTTRHLDLQVVGYYGCHCDACQAERAAEAAAEIDAEMAIERYYEGGWDKSGEYEAFERYEQSLGLIG